jgi:hypothetical protein
MVDVKPAELMKLYNLPQNVEGGLPIHNVDVDGKKITILFHHLDGMYSNCTIKGTNKVVHLDATTPIIYEDGEYRVGEEA